MNTTVTIEPASVTYTSDNDKKPYTVSFLTTIPLEIPWGEAWEIIEDIIRTCFPNENVQLEAVTEDLSLDRYCFSITGKITPEALEVTVNV